MNEQSAFIINEESHEKVVKENEEEKRKELKRIKTNARQRAYYYRQKDLKKNEELLKTVPKSNAERQREFRQRQVEKSYMDIKRRKLCSNEKNIARCSAVENIENVTLQENKFNSQHLHLYEQRNECITPEVILHRNTGIPGDDADNTSDYNFWENQKSMIDFVKIVQRFPELYSSYEADVSRSRYHLDYAWKQVYDTVKSEMKMECTLDDLKARWKGIRSSFGRYRTRCYNAYKDGTGPPRRYYLTDALTFLVPHLRMRGVPNDSIPEEFFNEIACAPATESDIKEECPEDDVPLSAWIEVPELTSIKSEAEDTYDEIYFTETKVEPMVEIPIEPPEDIKPQVEMPIEMPIELPIERSIEPPAKKPKTDEKESNDEEIIQFFKCILPDIAHFSTQEKRKLKIGVLQLVDDIANSRELDEKKTLTPKLENTE